MYKTFDYPVLVDFNFHVDVGETVAIIGRSGVGKSVALQHIMGFMKPDEGQVIVANQDITHMREAELRAIRKKVTMVFQSGALFDSMTVAENILFSMELRDDYDSSNKEEVVQRPAKHGRSRGFRRQLPDQPFHGFQTLPWRLPGLWLRNRNAFSMTSRPRWSTRSCPINWAI